MKIDKRTAWMNVACLIFVIGTRITGRGDNRRASSCAPATGLRASGPLIPRIHTTLFYSKRSVKRRRIQRKRNCERQGWVLHSLDSKSRPTHGSPSNWECTLIWRVRYWVPPSLDGRFLSIMMSTQRSGRLCTILHCKGCRESSYPTRSELGDYRSCWGHIRAPAWRWPNTCYVFSTRIPSFTTVVTQNGSRGNSILRAVECAC